MQGPAGRILAGPWNYMCFLCTLGITLHEPSEDVLELLDVNRGDDDVLDRAVLEAGLNALNSVNDLLGCLVSDLTEDGVAAVQPGGLNGGDEELGTLPAGRAWRRRARGESRP